MLNKKNITIILICLAITIFQQCTKKDSGTTTTPTTTIPGGPTLPVNPFNYVQSFPTFIQNALNTTDNTPPDNPITNDGATLGRVLFYDKNLSKNNTISCANCHKQLQSFDDDSAVSKGFAGGHTPRNSMALLNIRFYKSGKMFWDERSPTLEKQVLQPIQNTVEMGLTLAELESRVQSLAYYPALFQKAFGSTTIDSIKIAKALAQFCRSIVTYQSKYDQVKQGLASFSTQEAQGEQTFLTVGTPTCAGCHAPPMFLTSTPAGPFAFRDAADSGINGQNRFKVGSLRNIGIRKFLFHNGQIPNLQTMLAGVPGTPPIPAHTVAPQDVPTILAFLNTLTDNAVLTDEKFSTPFK